MQEISREKLIVFKSKVASMLTLTSQSEIVSLVNDFHDLSIRNDVSYGSHKVSEYMQMMMTSPSFVDMLRDS